MLEKTPINEETQVLNDGRAAWKRIEGGPTWTDWVAVGLALEIGRSEAMRNAATNKPLGAAYNREMGAWLRANGFDGIDKTTRSHLSVCTTNRDAIEKWHSALPSERRLMLNHPCAVLRTWRKANSAAVAGTKKETLREANLRLTEENDRLNRQLSLENTVSPKDQARSLFESNGYDKCRQIVEELSRLLEEGVEEFALPVSR